MNIQCTKKLLDKMKVKPEEIADKSDFFDWHANLIQFNSHNTIVFTNNLFRYSIILYKIKAADLKQIDRLFQKSLIEIFHGENIDQKLIDKYILQAGKMRFTKTSDRSVLSSMNQTWMEMPFFADEVDHEAIIQTDFNLFYGTHMQSYKEHFFIPQDLLIEAMKIYQAESTTDMTLVQLMKNKPNNRKALLLKIRLLCEDQDIWRVVAVPASYTYEQLHRLIQIIFNWRNEHLHQFEILSKGDKPVALSKSLAQEDFAFSSHNNVELFSEKKRIFPYLQEYKKIRYRYDFGDDWVHMIELIEDIDDLKGFLPVCLDGDGTAPPENVGGPGGYIYFLSILNGTVESDEKEDLIDWVQEQSWQPFDIQRINERLMFTIS